MAPRSPRDDSTLHRRSVASVDDPAPIAPLPARAPASAIISSKVPFYPPSESYWRIGGEWYDFSSFDHPGGKHILRIARDRFEDCTYVFESHHMNYKKARAIIRKYEISESKADPRPRPSPETARSDGAHLDAGLLSGKLPTLLGDDAFYSVFRRRVQKYLDSVGRPDGGPTTECLALWWLVLASYVACVWGMWYTGSFFAALGAAFTGAFVGAFGHNWVHQPKFYQAGYGLLSMDLVGFSSENWYREHVLQHHMYTNTPWDNHFKGTDPFLITDPTRRRNVFQTYVTPILHPLVLIFGVYGNYAIHTWELLHGREKLSVGKLFLPCELAIMCSAWGWQRGLALLCTQHFVMSYYYFTMALMNHNAEHCHNVEERNGAKDWGEAQLHVSADWGTDLGFKRAIVYLWLNFHGVHHLVPKLDFSHHPAVQRILRETAEEFGLKYHGDQGFWEIWREMVRSFANASSLYKEIFVYGGAL